MPPGRDEYRGRRVMVSPRIPESVHLPAETDHDRMPERGHRGREPGQVGIVGAGGYLRQRDPGRIYLHDGGRAVLCRRLGKGRLERLVPAAVIADQIGLPADRLRKLVHLGVRFGRLLLVHADIPHGSNSRSLLAGVGTSHPDHGDRGRDGDHRHGGHDDHAQAGLAGALGSTVTMIRHTSSFDPGRLASDGCLAYVARPYLTGCFPDKEGHPPFYRPGPARSRRGKSVLLSPVLLIGGRSP